MGKRRASNDNALLESKMEAGHLRLSVSGRLEGSSVAKLWPDLVHACETKGVQAIELEGSGISYCDSSGASLLVYARRLARRLGVPLEITGLDDDVANLLALFPDEKLKEPPETHRDAKDFVSMVGRETVDLFQGLKQQIAFLGEMAAALARTLLHPASLRIRDLLAFAEAAGVKALPIVALLGTLIGLIMAFQGAVLMKQFGAQVFVADFVGISVVRELGPLITAIVVAGRTGSAFAAEIGTMKVNEEIDALKTMGLNPMNFLVVPRMLAATAMTPLLALFANICGILGGAVIMMGMGFPLTTYMSRAFAAISMTSYLAGLVKSLAFGILIAGAGCLSGLQTGEGASAVGRSATRAVVDSIVLIVFTDGLFAVIFYYLGI